jgi:hypothetical protein
MTNEKKQQLQELWDKLAKWDNHVEWLRNIGKDNMLNHSLLPGYFRAIDWFIELGLISSHGSAFVTTSFNFNLTQLGNELLNYTEEQENTERKNKLVESYYEEPDLQAILDKLDESHINVLRELLTQDFVTVSGKFDNYYNLWHLALITIEINSLGRRHTITPLGTQLLAYIDEKEKKERKPYSFGDALESTNNYLHENFRFDPEADSPKTTTKYDEKVSYQAEGVRVDPNHRPNLDSISDPMQELLNEWDRLHIAQQDALLRISHNRKDKGDTLFEYYGEQLTKTAELLKQNIIELVGKGYPYRITKKGRLMLELVRIRQELQDLERKS